ncbi:MAG: phosphoglycerate mutase family protein [Fibrobacter sp.]|nr:phosphoglycerate mutase family protein [Fibrobacter sp.]
MKKLVALPLSVLAAVALTACGDDSSTSPENTTPSSGIEQPGSSDSINPGSSDGIDIPGSSALPTDASSSSMDPVGPGQTTSSGSTATTVEFTTEAVVAPEINCTTAPAAAGVDVTCDGQYVGNIMDDSDPTPFNEAAITNLDFVGIQKIFAALQPTDKVVFVMRHAHRTSSTDASGVLTGLGYLQAQAVGAKIKSDEEIKYWHSEVPRTEQTCKAIAWGRGQTTISHIALADLNGGWFEKDHSIVEGYNASVPSSYEVISRWAYNEYGDLDITFDDGFYDLMERGTQFINEIVIGKIAPQSRISIAISHDQMLYPLAIFASNRQIDMRYHEDKSWLNFIAGIAVIIKPDNTSKVVLVKGLDSGFQ